MSNIKLFQDKKIRSVWDEEKEQWYFSVVDVVAALTDSSDPKQYIKKMRARDPQLNANWGTICTPVQMTALDGKSRKITASDIKGLFRLIQSIPSPKAEPFKLWLSQVGYERVLEIENPELAQERMKVLYEQKGYPKDWIDKRIRGMAIRQNLTDEWKKRGITEEKDYATQSMLKWFIDEQVEEEENVKTLIDNLRMIKDNGFGLYMIDKELGARTYTQAAPLAKE